MVDRMAGRFEGRARIGLTFGLLMLLTGCSEGGGGASAGAGAAGGTGAGPSAAAGGGGGGAIGAAVAAGGDLCKLLGPGDFANAGVSGAAGPSENNQPPSAYYCVYRGKSSATGGIELDVFLSDTAADAHGVFPEMFGEYLATNVKTVTIPGADEAQMVLPTFEGSTDPALIGVRKGKLTFGLGMGTAFANAQHAGEQLQQLALLVLQRAAALGS